MKNLKIVALSAMMLVSSTGAFAHGGGHGHGPGYNDGFIDALLVSTAGVFATFVSHHTLHHKELVYIGAADEAAAFLQNGGEPSALLREAMDTERAVCIQAGVEGAEKFDDEVLAELVVGRSAQLNN